VLLTVLFRIKIDENVYQWGNIFPKKTKDKQKDGDLVILKESSLFDGGKIIQFSGKYRMCAAIVDYN
jgi:hypothetical protein